MLSAGYLIILHITSGFMKGLRKGPALCNGNTGIIRTVQDQERWFFSGDHLHRGRLAGSLLVASKQGRQIASECREFIRIQIGWAKFIDDGLYRRTVCKIRPLVILGLPVCHAKHCNQVPAGTASAHKDPVCAISVLCSVGPAPADSGLAVNELGRKHCVLRKTVINRQNCIATPAKALKIVIDSFFAAPLPSARFGAWL